MFSVNTLSQFIQGIQITKQREQNLFKWQVKKGKIVVGEAYCKPKKDKVELQMIKRLRPLGKGLMSILMQEIITDAKKEGKDIEIEVKPFNDPNRPYEGPTQARKRVYNWYKNFGFAINGDYGIYKN